MLRNQNGAPITGYAVLIQHDGDGVLRPESGSTYVGPIQTGGVMATDSNGVAFMVYTAGFDLRTVTVQAPALQLRRQQLLLQERIHVYQR